MSNRSEAIYRVGEYVKAVRAMVRQIGDAARGGGEPTYDYMLGLIREHYPEGFGDAAVELERFDAAEIMRAMSDYNEEGGGEPVDDSGVVH